jgi:hypothetical protein
LKPERTSAVGKLLIGEDNAADLVESVKRKLLKQEATKALLTLAATLASLVSAVLYTARIPDWHLLGVISVGAATCAAVVTRLGAKYRGLKDDMSAQLFRPPSMKLLQIPKNLPVQEVEYEDVKVVEEDEADFRA